VIAIAFRVGGGVAMPRKYASLEERIIANSVASNDTFYEGTPCWIWLGATVTNRSGKKYGKIMLRWKAGKRKGQTRTAYAHRISLSVFRGRRLTARMVAKHLCNNTLCVNPMHLEGGSQISNVRQCVVQGRHGNMYLAPVRELERLAA